MTIVEIPNFADMTLESHDKYGRDRDQWPLFRTAGAEALMGHIENMLAFYEEKGLRAVFCFYMHPWEFHAMPEGAIHYGEGAVLPDPFIVENCGQRAVRELGLLIEGLKGKGAKFVAARDVIV